MKYQGVIKLFFKDERVEPESSEKDMSFPLRLLWVGIIITFIGILISISAVFSDIPLGGEASGGVIIFIGPFPIIFGAGPQVPILIILGLIITLIMAIIAFFMIFSRR